MPKRKVLLDQFFTSSVLALKCIQELEQVVDLDDYEQILEPSAGSGRFLDHLPSSKLLFLSPFNHSSPIFTPGLQ